MTANTKALVHRMLRLVRQNEDELLAQALAAFERPEVLH
jgi:hypothetical protein